MSYTKRQIIKDAFEEIGLGAYAYTLQPEDWQTALRRLSTLLASWRGYGAITDFPSTDTPSDDDLDADSEVPVDALRGVVCGLAVDLASGYGKQVSPTTMTAAEGGRKLMIAKNTFVPQKLADRGAVPAGAGHKYENRINLPEHDVVIVTSGLE